MSLFYCLVPLVAVVAFIVGWFWFYTWLGVRSAPLETILEGYSRARPVIRIVLVVGCVLALLTNLFLWATRGEPYSGTLLELLFVLCAIPLFFMVFWMAVGTTKISLQGQLILNITLCRKYVRREVVEDPEVARTIRERVEERAWFHRALFRLRKLELADVLNRVCPVLAED